MRENIQNVALALRDTQDRVVLIYRVAEALKLTGALRAEFVSLALGVEPKLEIEL